MNYQFDVEIQALSEQSFPTVDEADAVGEAIGYHLLAGSLLEKEYPEWDFEIDNDVRHDYRLRFTFSFKILFESRSLEEAKGEVDGKVQEMVAGSALAAGYIQKEPTLSDEQPGLDELLSWIDENEPFCIQADANRWHIDCARIAYGEHVIDTAIAMSGNYSDYDSIRTPDLYERYPQDQEGNLIHVVYGHEWIRDVRNAFCHEEEIPASCACLNSLYDEPREDEE